MDADRAPLPTRRHGLRLGFGLGLGLGGALLAPRAPAAAALQWQETALLAFGTTLWLRAAHADAQRARDALAAAALPIQAVDSQLSLHRADSALCRLNRDGVLDAAPPLLRELTVTALHLAARSGGLFDPTVQPVWQAWRVAQQQGRRPSAAELARARALVGWRGVRVAGDRIGLERPGMALTFNGIAQGYAADLARAALRQHGIEHALLDTGEWLPIGRPDEHADWRLGIAATHPGAVLATVLADGRALACSADATTVFSADRRDHHIIDPRSGYSPRELSLVVVAAPTATLADALTKPLFMASAADALALAKRWNVDTLVIDKSGRRYATPGLRLSQG